MPISEAINIVMEVLGRACLGATCVYIFIEYLRTRKDGLLYILTGAIIVCCIVCPMVSIITGYIVVIASTVATIWTLISFLNRAKGI